MYPMFLLTEVLEDYGMSKDEFSIYTVLHLFIAKVLEAKVRFSRLFFCH